MSASRGASVSVSVAGARLAPSKPTTSRRLRESTKPIELEAPSDRAARPPAVGRSGLRIEDRGVDDGLVQAAAPRRRVVIVGERRELAVQATEVRGCILVRGRQPVQRAVAVELEVLLVEAGPLLARHDGDERAEVLHALGHARGQGGLVLLEPLLVGLFLAELDRVAALRDETHWSDPQHTARQAK